MTLQHYHLGCPEWANKDWNGEFFPAKTKASDFLKLYSSVFNTVEGNTTFYALPKAETVQRWKEEAASNFRFCFKFPKTISHQKRLKQAHEETHHFLRWLSPLEERLGPFFLQLPASFGPNEVGILEKYLRSLPNAFRYAVEVRNLQWFDAGPHETRLNELLWNLQIDRVIFDTRELHAAPANDPATEKAQQRKPKVPVRFVATSAHPFLRFVGHPDLEKNRNTLALWADQTVQWIEEGRHPYIFIHTPDDFYAPRLARHFHDLLAARLPDIGNLPLPPIETHPHPQDPQLSLF